MTENRVTTNFVLQTVLQEVTLKKPGAGSNLQGMKTFAEQDGDDFVLNGSKVFITGGINADMVLVCARTDKTVAKAAHGISIFCVDTNLPGFKKGRNLRKIGLGVSSIQLIKGILVAL